MKHLTKILGLAPSELTLSESLLRVKSERARVSSELTRFREAGGMEKLGKKPKAKAKTSSPSLDEILRAKMTPEAIAEMEKLGVSLNDLKEALKSQLKGEANGK